MSLSDGTPMMTMPVAPANNNGGGFGWGGDGSWFIVLFLIFAIFGWGGNGWGNGNGGGAMDNYVLASDFATLQRQIDSATSSLDRKGDSISNGLCDGFYQQAQLVNGVNLNMNNGFMTAELSRANQQAALMQQLNAMQMQAASCCCDTREAIQSVNYNLATQGCDTRNQVQNSTRDIIDAMNCGFRSIDQRLTAQEIAAKDAKIAEQNQQLFAAQLAASQNAQTLDLRNYVSGQFAYYNPPARPAYIVQNPNCCHPDYNNGCNSGCGCGC